MALVLATPALGVAQRPAAHLRATPESLMRHPAVAQYPADRPLPPVPDSLKGLMARASTPLLRMAALKRVANAYASRLDSAGTLAYARALGTLARQQHNAPYEGDALYMQGEAYFAIKLIPQALRVALLALPLHTGTRRADTQRLLGIIYAKLHQNSQALAMFRAAQGTYRAARMHKSSFIVDGDRGLLFMNNEQLDSADFYLLRAARGLQALPGQSQEAANSLQNLAAMHNKHRQYAAQSRYSWQSLVLYRVTHDSTRMGAVFNSLCVAAMYLDSLPQAIGYGRQALYINRRFRRLDGEQAALNNIGTCFLRRKQPDSAAVYFGRALASARRGGVPTGQGQYLFKLAQAAEAAQRPAEVLRYALEVEGLDSVHRSPAITLANLALLAKLAQARHDDAAALTYFQRQRTLEQRQAAAASSKEITTLRVQFDTERTEQQLALATARAIAEAQRAALQAQRATALHLLGQQQTAAYRDTLSQRERQALRQQLRAEQEAGRAAQARQQVSALRQQTQQARLQTQAARLRAQQQELATLRARQQALGVAVLAGLVLVGGGLWFQRYRRRQAATRAADAARLRTRLAADLHDDVGSLLTQINMQSDLLRMPNASPTQTLARLDRLGEASRQAARQMSDVVWGLQETSTTLPEVLVHMRDHAHEVLPPAGLVVDFGVSPAVEALVPPAAVCQHLYLIYKECLHNVVKHARGATQVTVHLSHQADQLCLMVQDNAPGPAVVGRIGGHGLANMQRRAEAVGGNVRVEAGAEGFGVKACLPA